MTQSEQKRKKQLKKNEKNLRDSGSITKNLTFVSGDKKGGEAEKFFKK